MAKKRLVVIGGGAAGFFCAVNAAKICPELEITIIEKTSKLLSKVKVSGGGRCNVTHACYSIAEMVKRYPRGAGFLKKAFYHFFTGDTIEWFRERDIELKTEADGRMFPESNSSQTIIDCLLKEAGKYHVEIMMNAEVMKISSASPVTYGPVKNQEKGCFSVEIKNNGILYADYICIACGGYPKPLQFEWLTGCGHTIAPPVPSLFTFNMPQNPITALMGIAVEHVSVKINGTKMEQSGPLLITHWGLSGPAILKLSAWGARELANLDYSFTITVNWLPAYHESSLKEKMQQVRFDIASQKMHNRNPFGLPARLWEFFLQQCDVHADLRWADLPAKEQNKLIKILCAQSFSINGKTTFKEEFVTAGGIRLEEIDVNTMQSKLIPSLFFAGEIINADGITGGYNFQNAWTTGWIAAKGIAQANNL